MIDLLVMLVAASLVLAAFVTVVVTVRRERPRPFRRPLDEAMDNLTQRFMRGELTQGELEREAHACAQEHRERL